MLHYQRRRQQAMADAEAKGQSFWSDKFDTPGRTRLWAVLNDRLMDGWAARAAIAVEMELGIASFESGFGSPGNDFRWGFFNCGDDLVPSLVEASVRTITARRYEEVGLEEKVNRVLLEERISFELIEQTMVEKESQELHAELVGPTLRLLSGRTGWDNVESAYQDALGELSHGKPADAITDAGTALQEALLAVGASGNSLGPLMKDAKRQGLLAPHDGPLEDGIAKLIDWVSADRSSKGDAHNSDPALIEDAWLAVHIVGALILRLSGEPRLTT